MADSAAPDLSQLRELVAELRKLGVTRYRTSELELDLGAAPLPDAGRAGIVDENELRQRLEQEEEELLYAASEGFAS